MGRFSFDQLPEAVFKLLQKVEDIERLLLKSEATNTPQETEEVKFSIRELAEYLGCSIATIHNKKKEGELPYYRLGRKIYFLKSEIDEQARVVFPRKMIVN